MRSTTVAALALVCVSVITGCSSSKSGVGEGPSTPASTPVSSTPAASTTPTPTTPVPTTPVPTTPAATTSSLPAPATSTVVAPGTTAGSSTPAGSIFDFAGQWTGHSRFVTISPAGVGKESLGDGCCDPQLDLTYTLSGPSASAGGSEKATITVSAVTVHTGYSLSQPAPKVGDVGSLTLTDGVLTDSLTQSTYCDSAQESEGTCGA